jgi:hypothetical protein
MAMIFTCGRRGAGPHCSYVRFFQIDLGQAGLRVQNCVFIILTPIYFFQNNNNTVPFQSNIFRAAAQKALPDVGALKLPHSGGRLGEPATFRLKCLTPLKNGVRLRIFHILRHDLYSSANVGPAL